MTRFQQRVTALNYAIQTTPPPRNESSRAGSVQLNLELFQLYIAANARDLAADRLKAVIDMSQTDDLCATRHVSSSSSS